MNLETYTDSVLIGGRWLSVKYEGAEEVRMGLTSRVQELETLGGMYRISQGF